MACHLSSSTTFSGPLFQVVSFPFLWLPNRPDRAHIHFHFHARLNRLSFEKHFLDQDRQNLQCSKFQRLTHSLGLHYWLSEASDATGIKGWTINVSWYTLRICELRLETKDERRGIWLLNSSVVMVKRRMECKWLLGES